MKDNINKPLKGLYTDSTPLNQPKGTYRFALNTINSTFLGDKNSLSNENGNKGCLDLPDGFVLIGKVYVGNNETVLFSVDPVKHISNIGIMSDNCEYRVLVSDKVSKNKLNFKVFKQIQAIYRLRRGCDKTIYWVDDYNKPMYFILDRPEKFKTDGIFNGELFNLQKTYNTIPIFENIKVNNSGGELKSGSYNIAIQLVDNDLNATEWITVSQPVNIFYEDLTLPYETINGSINSDTDYLNFPITNKSIEVKVSNLDVNYNLYRLAFIEATSGNGLVSKVKVTDIISIKDNTFIYTGENYKEIISEEEVSLFNDIISSANSIEQSENRLILGGIKGKEYNFCNLQTYASKINADAVLKQVNLNDINSKSNFKNPLVHLNNIGYMPGETYSFGIVYVFKDGTVSPVYHIPGKSSTMYDSNGNSIDPNKVIFINTGNTFPMSINNVNDTQFYTQDSKCNKDYWGKDSQGSTLKGANVRHHTFPYRKDFKIPLYTHKKENVHIGDFLKLRITGDLSGTDLTESYIVKVSYIDANGDTKELFRTIDDSDHYEVGSQVLIQIDEALDSSGTINNYNNITIEEKTVSTNNVEVIPNGGTSSIGLTYEIEIIPNTVYKEVFKGNVFGIKFSNIEIPPKTLTNGNEIIGYYIVRQERNDKDKRIIDSGVLFQTSKYSDYIGVGLTNSRYKNRCKNNIDNKNEKLSKNVFGIINNDFKFLKKENLKETTNISQQEIYTKNYLQFKGLNINDVAEGSSYDEDHIDTCYEDNKGVKLHTLIRDKGVDVNSITPGDEKFNFNDLDIKEINFLKALSKYNITYNDEFKDVFNTSVDNHIGILVSNKEIENDDIYEKMPYVYFERDLSNQYTQFKFDPYYKISNNLETNSITDVFGGDIYISPIRYQTSVYYKFREAWRKGKKSLWKWVAAAFLIILSVGLIIVSAGLLGEVSAILTSVALSLGLTTAGYSFLLAESAITQDKWNEAYEIHWKKGLKETARDYDTCRILDNWQQNWDTGHERNTVYDDSIQWTSDIVSNLWFESTINTALRHRLSQGTSKYFLDAPAIQEDESTYDILGSPEVVCYGRNRWYKNEYPIESILESYLFDKFTFLNIKRGSSREYKVPTTELYLINKDYLRMNKQKVYFHLPYEYDCCSKCNENFPHRIKYSEQSFQEELTDNYRTFKHNNYRDIEGKSGYITNIFTIKNRLFIHTSESLWELPKTLQERVTDQVVSFIGTGSFFSIPPVELIDESFGNRAGSIHKWATIKTDVGIFFVSENTKKIYQFNGAKLKEISLIGQNNWFKENIEVLFNKQYEIANNNIKYKYDNNPSNKYGTGYISTVDYTNDRILFTKKDFEIINLKDEKDYRLCNINDTLYIFRNFSNIISQEAVDDWIFEGFRNCKLYFTKKETQEVIKTVYEYTGTENVIIGYFLDVLIHIPVPQYNAIQIKIYDTNIIEKYIDGEEFIPKFNNNSWTKSFSYRNNTWTSFHSYLPNFYINTAKDFFSWLNDMNKNTIWKHNIINLYNSFYGKKEKHIIEYVSNDNYLITKDYNSFKFNTNALLYLDKFKQFLDKRHITFNKAVIYNSRQMTGELNLKIKDTEFNQDIYLNNQIINNNNNQIIIDKNEGDWAINDLRDLVIKYDEPLWDNSLEAKQNGYFIDKVINTNILDTNKDWEQLETFKDKYLVIRLIFDKFANIKLITNFSIENEQQSYR